MLASEAEGVSKYSVIYDGKKKCDAIVLRPLSSLNDAAMPFNYYERSRNARVRVYYEINNPGCWLN